MHTVKPYLPTITVTWYDTHTVYDDARQCYYSYQTITNYWTYRDIHDLIHSLGADFCRYGGFTVISELGDKITEDDIPPEYIKPYVPMSWWCGGKRNFNGFRSIKTTNERRQSFIDDEAKEYGIKARPKRNATNLPDSWDDIWKWRNKNWKSFRKTQYKTK